MGVRSRRLDLRSDTGSVTAEFALAAPLLMLLLVFVAIVIHRGVDAHLRLNDAAHQAARAATTARTAPAAANEATNTATNALSSAGIACSALTVDSNTADLRPGGNVSVILTCEVDFKSALLLGVPWMKQISATAIERVDVWRSAIPNGGRQ